MADDLRNGAFGLFGSSSVTFGSFEESLGVGVGFNPRSSSWNDTLLPEGGDLTPGVETFRELFLGAKDGLFGADSCAWDVDLSKVGGCMDLGSCVFPRPAPGVSLVVGGFFVLGPVGFDNAWLEIGFLSGTGF